MPGAGEDLAVLLYTSAYRGLAEGRDALPPRPDWPTRSESAALDPAPVGPDDVVLLACCPCSTAYGLNAGLGAVVFHGACGVLVERFDPAVRWIWSSGTGSVRS